MRQSSSLPNIQINRTAYEKSVLLRECEERLARAHTQSDLMSKASSPATSSLRAVAKKAGRVLSRGSYQVEELQMKQWAGSWESVSLRSGVGRPALAAIASEALLSEETRHPERAESDDAVDEPPSAEAPRRADIWRNHRSAIVSHLRAQREERMVTRRAASAEAKAKGEKTCSSYALR